MSIKSERHHAIINEVIHRNFRWKIMRIDQSQSYKHFFYYYFYTFVLDWLLEKPKLSFPGSWYWSFRERFLNPFLHPWRPWYRFRSPNQWCAEIDRRGAGNGWRKEWRMARWISQPRRGTHAQEIIEPREWTPIQILKEFSVTGRVISFYWFPSKTL